MSLSIAQLGQPVLWQSAAEVQLTDIAAPEFQQFLQAMRDTLREQKGAGLAAPQVFDSRRVFLAAILPPEVAETSGAPRPVKARGSEVTRSSP